MNNRQATDALRVLGDETCMRVLRLLASTGHADMSAKAIGEAIGMTVAQLGPHLARLEEVNLLETRRHGRSPRYSTGDGLAGLITFLKRDCCGGRPDACAGLLVTMLSSQVDAPPEAEQCQVGQEARPQAKRPPPFWP